MEAEEFEARVAKAVAARFDEARKRRVGQELALTMLFDPDHGLSERIIAEQFTV